MNYRRIAAAVPWPLVGSAVLALACGNDSDPIEPRVAPEAPEAPTEIVRDTCADNPLLAGCQGPNPTPSPGPAPGNSNRPPAAVSELDLARAAAENILRANCGQCHGPALTPATARAGMNYIDDIDLLVENGKLMPLDAEASSVVRRMRDGSMPPVGTSGPRPSTRDIDTVAQFVDNASFWPEFRPAQRCDGQLMGVDELYRDVQVDLLREDAEDRPFLRYVTLVNRYNAGICSDALERDRFAISKLVNMVSTRTRVRAPIAVDRDRLIYRLDLRDYDWDRAVSVDGTEFRDAWEAIIAQSPYAIPFVGDQADDIREDTLTDVPVLAADAMLDVAAIGNLYYALIGVDANQPLSSFVSDQLGIDIQQNFLDGDVVRAGTSRSQISRQDRVLERHEIQVRRGVYWQSFDFEADDAGQSIFADPFGFSQGGTEVIFTLPNGMLGFIIADRDGNIAEESEILLDTFQNDFVARTAVSCSNCHAQGFNVAVDEVRPYVLENRLFFNRDDFESVTEVYPSAADFARIIQADSRLYQQTLVRAQLPETGSDPVANGYIRFNLDVDLATAAGDIGVSPELLRRNINLLDPALGVLRNLGIDRDDFTSLFAATQCILLRASANQPDPELCARLVGSD